MKTNTDKEKSFTRKALYDLVWSKPVSKILEEHAISQTGFKNLCKENNIPLPSNGYWSKLRHNVKVEIIELPNPSDNHEILINDSSNVSLNSPHAKLNHLKKEILKDPNLNFDVPNRLVRPDALIVAAKKGMEAYQKGRYYLKGTEVSTMENQISITVGKENISRSLRFMDTLVKLVKKRGHFIEVDQITRIVINKQKIEVRFREIMKREQHPEYSWISKMPSGILSFRIDSHNSKEWRDSEKRPLETRLADILAKLEMVSQEMEKYQIELERGWEEQRIRREIEEGIRKNREKEISDFKNLINSSGRWHKAQNLRKFLDAFEAEARASNALDENRIQWLQWARSKADWYDPFIEKEDAVFENVDRDTLELKKRGWWD